jgi:hypothetical protein
MSQPSRVSQLSHGFFSVAADYQLSKSKIAEIQRSRIKLAHFEANWNTNFPDMTQLSRFDVTFRIRHGFPARKLFGLNTKAEKFGNFLSKTAESRPLTPKYKGLYRRKGN